MKKLILLLLVFIGGALQVSAGTKTTVYYAVPSATVGSYTVKLNIALQYDGEKKEAFNWATYTMTKTAKTYDGMDIYTCTYTDSYDGVGTMQFQLWDGGSHKGQQQPYDSWTSVGTYNGKIYVHDTGWKNYRNDATVYLKPNSNWAGASAWFAIYLEDDNSNNAWEKFTSVTGHDGYYKVDVSGKWTKAILCRMNPSVSIETQKASPSWAGDVVWNQCPTGSNRITLLNQDACYTPSDWSSDSYDDTLVPWEYYFMNTPEKNSDTWNAVEAMTNSAGTCTYSFSGATYAGKRVAWASGTSFNASKGLKSWNDVCKSKSTANNDDWILFQNFSYDSVDKGTTGSAWYVPASNDSQYNDGTITITFNSSTKAATITSEKTATIGAAGYLTWSNTEKYTVSEGTAYAVKDMGDYAKLTQITNGTVLPEKNNTEITGILLKGTNGDIVKFSSVAPDAATTTYTNTYAAHNDLLGSGNSTADISAGCYVLYWDGEDPATVGFKVTTAGTLGAHKAYLPAPAVPTAREFLGFEENVTAINTVKTGQSMNGEFFNLAGQRVAQPTRGLYIVNGKKVLIK